MSTCKILEVLGGECVFDGQLGIWAACIGSSSVFQSWAGILDACITCREDTLLQFVGDIHKIPSLNYGYRL